MAQNSWPFVGGGGTAVNEDQWSIMARFWAQSGVTDYANMLEVYGDSSGRQVKVKTGRACVRGHWYENTAVETVAIAANASGNPRIDRIVLRLDPSANSIVLAVVQGTPAGSPSAPALTQTDVGTYELTLARVAVANGASTIAAGDVTDERTYVDGIYGPWTPVITASSSNPTASATSGENRYTRVGDQVTGVGHMQVTAAGSGTIRIPLPMAPRSSASSWMIVGEWLLVTGSGTATETGQIVKVAGQNYCHARRVPDYINTVLGQPSADLTHSRLGDFVAAGTTYLVWRFTYEAA